MGVSKSMQIYFCHADGKRDLLFAVKKRVVFRCLLFVAYGQTESQASPWPDVSQFYSRKIFLINEFYEVSSGRSWEHKALKLWKVRSGKRRTYMYAIRRLLNRIWIHRKHVQRGSGRRSLRICMEYIDIKGSKMHQSNKWGEAALLHTLTIKRKGSISVVEMNRKKMFLFEGWSSENWKWFNDYFSILVGLYFPSENNKYLE